MTAGLTLDAYLEFLAKEYLGDFVARGGASVKFVVAEGEVAERFHAGLAATAVDGGYAYAGVDSAATKVHQVDQILFALSRQLDWEHLAARFVRSAYETVAFPVTDEVGANSVTSAAACHDVDQRELYRTVRRHLEGAILGDHAMAHEFRLAMLRLCQAQLASGDLEDAERDAVLDWLRGDLRQLARLRSSLIYGRVARHNARHLLLSTSHWLSRAGRAGLVLDLDITRLALARRPPVEDREGLYYSKAMVLDAYEVLRQFVDGTEDLASALVVVVAPPEFVTDESRGLGAYSALQLRLADEVRDRRRTNPFASLVRLGGVG